MGCSAVPLALESVSRSSRSLSRGLLSCAALAPAVIALGLRSRLPAFRRSQLYAGAPRFGKTNCNRLLGASRTVLAFANVVHFLVYEFARLGAGCFPLACVFSGFLDG